MRKKTKWRKRIALCCVFLIVIFICISIYFNNIVYVIISKYAKAKVKEMTVAAVNKAILNVISEDLLYSDLVEITTDNDGNITMMQANTVLINQIAQKTAEQSAKELKNIGEQILEIPVGSLTNSPLFTGYGPPISVKILSDGNVICRFKSAFDQAGINQTRHRIYIEVTANMDIVLPAASGSIDSVLEIYIAEAVLIGDVPHTFLNLNLGEYDFAP
jgi:sporulation protein YunB